MNIGSQFNTIPVATVVNPQTENLRRENNLREVITQPTAPSQSAAEKGVASDKDKAKTPAQNNEHIDFANIRKQAETANSTISDQSESDPDAQGQQHNEQASEHSHDGGEADPAVEFAEKQEIIQLKQRDREVRSHELAHAAVGGSVTGSPSYSFTIGPDGKKYATSGEVSVDLSTVPGDPQASIIKLKKVYAAALAPANPSAQDARVAAQASSLILQAQSELLQASRNESDSAGNKNDITASKKSLNGLEENNQTFESSDSGINNGVKSGENSSADFDRFMSATLAAQEQVLPTRPEEVTARAGRIENFYSQITLAYNKAPRNNFQLTA